MPETEGTGSSLDDVMAKFDQDARAQKEASERADAIRAAAAADEALRVDTPAPIVEEPAAAPAEAAVETPAAPQTYVVQAGDSLSAISEKVYGDAKYWDTIFAHNRDKISDPNLIYPGQELIIP
ncbi:MAG: LysM peptidoglycan-binding domain-containing protein [Anaerolineaceae bacterium]